MQKTKEEIEIIKKERIESYKTALENVAKRFYEVNLSDLTLVGSKPWHELKTDVCNSEEYRDQHWFQELSSYEQQTVHILKKLQLDVGVSESLQP